jgi:hypothetical protein
MAIMFVVFQDHSIIIHKYLKNKIKGETKMFPKFLILNFLVFILLAMQVEAAPFTDNSDGTIKDNATSLVWQKCSQGLSGTSCSSGSATIATWASAVSYCNSLSLASKTWRLPNVNELRTIVDYTKTSSPVIDSTAFPATIASGYWSSTTYAITTPNAWLVSFLVGAVGEGGPKTNSNCVRCVSGP